MNEEERSVDNQLLERWPRVSLPISLFNVNVKFFPLFCANVYLTLSISPLVIVSVNLSSLCYVNVSLTFPLKLAYIHSHIQISTHTHAHTYAYTRARMYGQAQETERTSFASHSSQLNRWQEGRARFLKNPPRVSEYKTTKTWTRRRQSNAPGEKD